jgi:hypothetical protein
LRNPFDRRDDGELAGDVVPDKVGIAPIDRLSTARAIVHVDP